MLVKIMLVTAVGVGKRLNYTERQENIQHVGFDSKKTLLTRHRPNT